MEIDWNKIIYDDGFNVAAKMVYATVLDRLSPELDRQRWAQVEGSKGIEVLTSQARKKKDTFLLEGIKKIDEEITQLLDVRRAPYKANEKHPLLCSARVTDVHMSKKLKKLIHEWRIHAVAKQKIAEDKRSGISEEKQKLANNSTEIMEYLEKNLPKRPYKREVYISYDTQGSIHAVALATMNKKKQTLDFLGTNPEDLLVLGTEKKVIRGAGSAIIRHIAQDVVTMKTKKDKKKLKLEALPEAVSFYKKLGFEAGKLHEDLI